MNGRKVKLIKRLQQWHRILQANGIRKEIKLILTRIDSQINARNLTEPTNTQQNVMSTPSKFTSALLVERSIPNKHLTRVLRSNISTVVTTAPTKHHDSQIDTRNATKGIDSQPLANAMTIGRNHLPCVSSTISTRVLRSNDLYVETSATTKNVDYIETIISTSTAKSSHKRSNEPPVLQLPSKIRRIDVIDTKNATSISTATPLQTINKVSKRQNAEKKHIVRRSRPLVTNILTLKPSLEQYELVWAHIQNSPLYGRLQIIFELYKEIFIISQSR